MKAFHAGVLRGLARLDVHQFDLPFDSPGEEVEDGQLRPVVTANRSWLATLRNDNDPAPASLSGW